MISNLRLVITCGLIASGLSLGPTWAQTVQLDSEENTLNLTAISTPVNAPLTLKAALAAAASYNPRILAAQQEYAISETDIRLARTARKPLIEANASYGYLDQDNSFTTAPGSSLSGETSDIGISLRQPLFRGFQTRNSIQRAKSNASAAQVQIKAVRQQVLLEVVISYLDVQRDKTILNLNLENLKTLQEQLEANEKRYELKDTSLTDVARSKSAVASAHTRIADARENYASSRSRFFRLTGQPAENLIPLTSIPSLPGSMEIFLTRAIQNNASITSAKYAVEASEYAVKEAKGARLPTVDLNSSVNRGERPENFGLFSDNRTTTSASAGVSVRVPLYQADQEFGNIKRAKQIRRLREIELAQTQINVRDNSRIIWDRLQTSKNALVSHEEAVKAAETAAIGTRKIYRSGLISAIDLIDTEQILLSSKIGHERAKHDLIEASYTLLSIIGDISYE